MQRIIDNIVGNFTPTKNTNIYNQLYDFFCFEYANKFPDDIKVIYKHYYPNQEIPNEITDIDKDNLYEKMKNIIMEELIEYENDYYNFF
jgi:hypothetical protein